MHSRQGTQRKPGSGGRTGQGGRADPLEIDEGYPEVAGDSFSEWGGDLRKVLKKCDGEATTWCSHREPWRAPE